MSNQYHIPTAWQEMPNDMFIRVAEALFRSSGMEVYQLRINVLAAIVNLEINTNVNCRTSLAHLTRFCINIYHNADVLAVVHPHLADLLTWCLPSEIDDINHFAQLQQVSQLLESKVSLNLNIKTNKVPTIAGFNGPVFNVDKNGIIETDLLAGEYLDALEFISAYDQSKDETYLASATACLYRSNRKKYTTFEAQKQTDKFIALPQIKAAWLMLLAWQNYFTTHPLFSTLYTTISNEPNNKVNVGASEMLYQFSKDGYGSVTDMVHMPIIDFLNLRIKSLRDDIYQLRANKIKDGEISRILHIPIQTVLKF